ncbi:MAG: SusC/RagA family protein, partial [Bacteroidaceae bacterium]|nr:SusC/RagA family protein [Bacteroidaceae bacterium]
DFLDRWVESGDEKVTNVPVIASYRQVANINSLSYAYNAYNYSDARVASGSFIRLKDISLTYELPKRATKWLGLGSASVKFDATNIWLVYSDKKLKGQDPEFVNSGGVALPTPKQLTLTVRLGI